MTIINVGSQFLFKVKNPKTLDLLDIPDNKSPQVKRTPTIKLIKISYNLSESEAFRAKITAIIIITVINK